MGVDDTLLFCLFVCLFIPPYCILRSDILTKRKTQRIPRNAFQFSFQPDWQMDVVFVFFFSLTGQSWCVLKSGYRGGGPRTRISALFRRGT